MEDVLLAAEGGWGKRGWQREKPGEGQIWMEDMEFNFGLYVCDDVCSP